MRFLTTGAGSLSLMTVANSWTCTTSYLPSIESGNGTKTLWAINLMFFGSHSWGGHWAKEMSIASMEAVDGILWLSSMGQMLTELRQFSDVPFASARRRLYQVPVPTSAIFKLSISSDMCGLRRPPNSSLNRWCWELSLRWSTMVSLALSIFGLPHNWVVVPTQRIVISCILRAGHWCRALSLVEPETTIRGICWVSQCALYLAHVNHDNEIK